MPLGHARAEQLLALAARPRTFPRTLRAAIPEIVERFSTLERSAGECWEPTPPTPAEVRTYLDLLLVAVAQDRSADLPLLYQHQGWPETEDTRTLVVELDCLRTAILVALSDAGTPLTAGELDRIVHFFSSTIANAAADEMMTPRSHVALADLRDEPDQRRAGLSRELRDSLHVIYGSTKLLRELAKTDSRLPVARALARIEAASSRIDALVDALDELDS